MKRGYVDVYPGNHSNSFPSALPGKPNTAWINDLCSDFSAHPFLRASNDHRPFLGKVAYGLDRLVTTAMSIPYKRKIQPHLSDTTLQEYPGHIDDDGDLVLVLNADGDEVHSKK